MTDNRQQPAHEQPAEPALPELLRELHRIKLQMNAARHRERKKYIAEVQWTINEFGIQPHERRSIWRKRKGATGSSLPQRLTNATSTHMKRPPRQNWSADAGMAATKPLHSSATNTPSLPLPHIPHRQRGRILDLLHRER